MTNGFLHTVSWEIQEVLVDEVLEAWDKLTPLMQNEWIYWVTIPKLQKTKDEHLLRF